MNRFKSPFLGGVAVMAVAEIIEDRSGSVAMAHFLYGLAILYAICFTAAARVNQP